MCRKVLSIFLSLAVAATMAGCGSAVLPVEEQEEPAPTATPVATDSAGMEIPVKEKTEEEIRAAYIADYKMRYVTSVLMQLPPIPTDAELERLKIEEWQQTPYQDPEDELINYCRSQSDMVVKEFLADYPTDDYTANEENRVLKKIYDGQTGREVNGGLDAVTIGYETGYWRITNCEYYSMAFYENGGDSNSIRILYLCDLYHYVLNDQDNLAEQRDDTELTTENSTVKEFPNSFLMVTMNDICPNDASDTFGQSQKFMPEVLLFTDFESAIKSVENPSHTFEDLYLNDDFTGSIVNGYEGQPIVTMPDLVGKYIDVSRPDNVRELDDLGIANYEVQWKENDGSLVPYSILSCNIEPGTLIDITDDSEDSKIIVTVADRAPDATAADEEDETSEPMTESEANGSDSSEDSTDSTT